MDDVRGHELPELRILEGPLVVVGPEGQHQDDPAPRVRCRRDQVVEESASDRLVIHHREQLFELVDEEQEPRRGLGQHHHGSPQQAGATLAELFGQAIGWVLRGLPQSCLGLGKGIQTRRHRGHEPAIGTPHGIVAQRRYQAGSHGTRLAGSTRPDHSQRILFAPQGPDHLVDESLAAMEYRSIGFLEWPETHEGVDGLRLPGRPDIRGRELETAVLDENLLLQSDQLSWRLDSQLRPEETAMPIEGPERLGLPVGPVEGEHELTDQSTSERMVPHQLLELSDELSGESAGQIGFDAVF